MKQRIHLVLLGVQNLQASVAFYEGLGWKKSPSGNPEFVLFDLGGVVMGLQSREAFAADARFQNGQGQGFPGMALAHVTTTPQEVYKMMERAASLGATIHRAAGPNPWGHSGYFADPDGHLFEVLYEDGWTFAPEGHLAIQ
ncbi:VOC family protein [Deinococcus cellulosilyticus]|uniref:VOC domain-containing protein n=1 Tax=Deinococcus cellulosilyticus (strain DSM 18568 / NBRC 106333 / KACC 11606 / 5516J-15) TaxID=1223518 RepID=A0A511N7I1_DEIC1|nr:VOC family protein [Deinococcus cellulosilyticus]GEM48371.1 hypothetical protein DC3_40060 [Deinococcus cellulosilyticus NBRC 106333 = KACC 11606]